MLRDASVICISSVDWAFNRQNPQEAADGLAAAGNRVLFIENTGARSVRPRDVRRLGRRLRNAILARRAARRAPRNIRIFSPVLVPAPYSRMATALNAAVVLRVVRRWLRGYAPNHPVVVISFLPTPLVRRVVSRLHPDLVVYYCIDRLAASSPGARRIAEHERQFAAEADLVLVTSPALYDDLAAFARRIDMLPSGVQCDAFARARAESAARRRDGIVAGFIGSLRESTDLALIAEAARLAPDITFSLAGPQFTSVGIFAGMPNVRIAGAMPFDRVPEAFADFDVGILPYVRDRFTEGLMPIKLKEFLAAGLPVVSTPLPAVMAFAADHPQLVTFADDAASFVDAIRAAAGRRDEDEAIRRMAVAREFDWSVQIARMGALMQDALTERCNSPR